MTRLARTGFWKRLLRRFRDRSGYSPAGSNQPPIAVPDTVTATAGGSAAFNLLSNDSDPDGNPLTLAKLIINGVDYLAGALATIAGVGTIIAAANGAGTFNPLPSYNGSIVVQYDVSDGTTTSRANITLTSVSGGSNSAPTSTPLTLKARPGEATPFNPLPWCFDNDFDFLSITGYSWDGVSYGPGQTATYSGAQIVIQSSGRGVFTPSAGAGTVTLPALTYTASDGKGGTVNGTINLSAKTGIPCANRDAFVALQNAGQLVAGETYDIAGGTWAPLPQFTSGFSPAITIRGPIDGSCILEQPNAADGNAATVLNNASGIIFENLTFKAANTSVQYYYKPYFAIYNDTHGITWRHCRFIGVDGVGNFGTSLGGFGNNVMVSWDAPAGTGLTKSLFDGCLFQKCSSGIRFEHTRNVEVTRCIIEDYSFIGIYVTNSMDINIHHNVIRNSRYDVVSDPSGVRHSDPIQFSHVLKKNYNTNAQIGFANKRITVDSNWVYQENAGYPSLGFQWRGERQENAYAGPQAEFGGQSFPATLADRYEDIVCRGNHLRLNHNGCFQLGPTLRATVSFNTFLSAFAQNQLPPGGWPSNPGGWQNTWEARADIDSNINGVRSSDVVYTWNTGFLGSRLLAGTGFTNLVMSNNTTTAPGVTAPPNAVPPAIRAAHVFPL